MINNPLIEGIVLGLTISIMIGPSFFALLQTSIHRGFKSGVLMAGGILISDLTLIVISFLGASTIIIDNQKNQFVFGLTGGIILVLMGLYTSTRKPQINGQNGDLPETKTPGALTYVLKGYFLNIANPFLIIWWMSWMLGISSNYANTTSSIYIFFSGALGAILLTDIFKVFIANKLKSFLTDKVLMWINRVVGISLIIFGLLLIFRVLLNLEIIAFAVK